MHVELLFAYVSAIALLTSIILYPSVRSYVKENLCFKGLWPCVAKAAPWFMVALVPVPVDAMESQIYRFDPLEKVPLLDDTGQLPGVEVLRFIGLQVDGGGAVRAVPSVLAAKGYNDCQLR